MKQTLSYRLRGVLVLSLTLLLAACGGGGGGGAPVSLPDTPVLSLDYGSAKQFRFTWADVAGETEYRLLENPDGASGYTEVASLGAGTTAHDLTVSLPQRINARYMLEACNSAGCSTSDEVSVAGNLAAAIGYLKASNTGMGDEFGGAVALSGDGNTLVVGARLEDSGADIIDGNGADDTATDAGAVYVFMRSGSDWLQQAYIKAADSAVGDNFGGSLTLSADGNTLAVGAAGKNGATGAVYVFERNAGAWSQQAQFTASNAEPGDGFGGALALSGDGDTLVVGAMGEDHLFNNVSNSGAAYVFERNGGMWTQQAYLKAANAGITDRFGSAVALSANGNTLVVGAPNEDGADNGTENDSGAAYVYTRDGGNWIYRVRLKAPNRGAGDYFGYSLAISASGSAIAVGAWGEDGLDNGFEDNSGAVYVFRALLADWSLWNAAYLKADVRGAGDYFGAALAFSDDGTRLAIGASGEDSSATGINGQAADDSLGGSGAAYLFTWDGGAWMQEAYIKAANTAAGDRFGGTVALSADGNVLAVGAANEDSGKSESGAAYLY